MSDERKKARQGIVFNIQRYSIHDGPGIRTTVFLKGCPLRCFWCQNPESQKKEPEILLFEDNCTLCGKCMDQCPNQALRYRLKGCRTADQRLSLKIRRRLSGWQGRLLAYPVQVVEEIFEARTLFVFAAIVFGGTLSGSMVTDAVHRLYLLATTGSLLGH